jgi:hypothetical protein
MEDRSLPGKGVPGRYAPTREYVVSDGGCGMAESRLFVER